MYPVQYQYASYILYIKPYFKHLLLFLQLDCSGAASSLNHELKENLMDCLWCYYGDMKSREINWSVLKKTEV